MKISMSKVSLMANHLAKAVPKIKERLNEDLPILEEVYAITEMQMNPKQAVERLMLRECKAEW